MNKKIWGNYDGYINFLVEKEKRIEKKKCGQCCLMCPYYRECRADGELKKTVIGKRKQER